MALQKRATRAEGLEGGALKLGRSGLQFRLCVLLLPHFTYKMKRTESNSLKDFIK